MAAASPQIRNRVRHKLNEAWRGSPASWGVDSIRRIPCQPINGSQATRHLLDPVFHRLTGSISSQSQIFHSQTEPGCGTFATEDPTRVGCVARGR